ncbi:MAG: carboxypeptidase-like regulatory domain-containing protein [Thermoanaerobaculia bacterium]
MVPISSRVQTVLLEALLLGGTARAVPGAQPVAAGRITDLQGRAVAGALVRTESWESQPLGSGRSDAEGRFEVALSQPVKDLTLIIEHPGFQRWALAGTETGQDRYQIRLTRRIDSAYLTELAAQSEPTRFRQLAMDLLAPSLGTSSNHGEIVEQVLPYLKSLRQRLRALLPEAPAQLRAISEPQNQAALLLAYLGDPRDDALVDAWAARQSFISRPPHPCRGPTPDAAARVWQKLHFEQEGYRGSQTIPFNALRTQIAPSGDHGLALYSVRYAYWGYSQYLVLVRLNDAWEVHRVIEGEHFDSLQR